MLNVNVMHLNEMLKLVIWITRWFIDTYRLSRPLFNVDMTLTLEPSDVKRTALTLRARVIVVI